MGDRSLQNSPAAEVCEQPGGDLARVFGGENRGGVVVYIGPNSREKREGNRKKSGWIWLGFCRILDEHDDDVSNDVIKQNNFYIPFLSKNHIF